MNKFNSLYFSARLTESDLSVLVSSLQALRIALSIAEKLSLRTKSELRGDDRIVTVYVPTEGLACFADELRKCAIPAGTLAACHDLTSGNLAKGLGFVVEIMPSTPERSGKALTGRDVVRRQAYGLAHGR